ncbi:hypothetical protein BIW11_04663 [Tropilaelaps mercedesae]|uniref:Uncharacterized protein n=1 Tax=Tropilaelaps mercedesae TaxID=418985 RepID=A0A1V9X3T0_9ACAR|nr:hypothetical protein BIW11_04663 [Tropilaelaps mercedesae]
MRCWCSPALLEDADQRCQRVRRYDDVLKHQRSWGEDDDKMRSGPAVERPAENSRRAEDVPDSGK